MDFDNISTGIDMEQIKRFEGKTIDNSEGFLKRIFTEEEIKYCFSKSNPAPHLCARYCAKEAAVKALTAFDITDVYYSDIGVTKLQSGMPILKIKKYPKIKTKLSLSHTKETAIAVVMLENGN